MYFLPPISTSHVFIVTSASVLTISALNNKFKELENYVNQKAIKKL